MHRQIGNAVPFPLSQAIGRSIGKTRFKHHLEKRIQPGPQEDSDDDLYM
jgi:hypothetical protein